MKRYIGVHGPKLTSESSFSLLFVSDSSISTSNVGLFERMFSRACASARRALNTPIYVVLVQWMRSAWCRQLDMRSASLRTYVPTQRRLAAPSSTQPRPANAHYIRMHNTLWLMAKRHLVRDYACAPISAVPGSH